MQEMNKFKSLFVVSISLSEDIISHIGLKTMMTLKTSYHTSY